MHPDFEPFPGSPAPEPGAKGAWVWQSRPAAKGPVILSDLEKARIARLVSEQQREQLRRSLTERRLLLSCLLAEGASEIVIAHDEQGKPCLPDHDDVSLSLSDSEGVNALALVSSGHVGIDIERVRPIGWEAMLSMVSARDEASLVRDTIKTTGETAIFLKCWTAKEAILKAVGTGLKGGAPRIGLPEDFIAGRTNQFRVEHDGMMLKVQSLLAGDVVLSRAVSV